MVEPTTLLVISAIFLVAVLYSSVGHGGASGYLAVMAFFAVAPEVTRPTALLLNLFVATIGTIQFYRAGYFSWRLFLPFAAGSIPMAFVGGMIHLPTEVYKIVLGAVLCLAAVRLAIHLKSDDGIKDPPLIACLLIGGVIGLLSGMVGVGGGIFLTPVLLLMHWAEARVAAGVSVLFILVNSISGLVGQFYKGALYGLPAEVWGWIGVAVIGGIIGSTLGSKRFTSMTLRRMLAAVLLFAGIKLIFV
ncbi:MAG: sulfite exporter TauE/SafE family protein [Pyrinomonadaceae bacterium]|nr:sulfite exporter TauE/SafE family protein [Pyrinomonadaceae bacterium]